MLETLEATLQTGNYAEAAQLLSTLEPHDPWTQLYWAKLWEVTQQEDQAEAAYRQILRQTDGPKLTLAARQGLDRLQAKRAQSRKQAIASATADPYKSELGVLVLAPIDPALKTEAAQAIANIMNLEPYSARMLLPSRGLRLYRVGAIGELEFYGQQLKDKGIPIFWQTLSKLQATTVYTAVYFESIEGIVRVAVRSNGATQELSSLQFSWEDVTTRVEGQVPIFEAVLDRDLRGKLLRKEKTQDHANFCDLHLPQKHYILRFCDTTYQFNQGVPLDPTAQTASPLKYETAWANWRQLSQVLSQKLPQQPLWSDFEAFAETALEHPDLLTKLPAHIDLFRREDSNWDPAFQLYSALLFLQGRAAS